MNRDTIEVPYWWKCGDRLIARHALPHNHPEHEYNYMKNVMGVKPEDYGVLHPLAKRFENHTREELMGLCAQLEEELESMHRINAMLG